MYTEHWNLLTLYHIYTQITNISTRTLCFNPKVYLQIIVTFRYANYVNQVPLYGYHAIYSIMHKTLKRINKIYQEAGFDGFA